MLKSRKYKSGTGWCVWRWTETPSGYVTRLHVLKTPWFAVMLHWFHHPDPEPDLHDHPVSFTSTVLKGWYKEDWEFSQYLGRSFHRWLRTRFIPATHLHAIREIAPGGCVTLCFVGPKVREWGYHTKHGWIPWREYKQTEVGS